MEFDLFISHASEDKDTFVRPLARALIAAGIKVWYDETTLRIGDNLRRSIDQGLAKSQYGLVVISKSFLAKNWPQWELDGLIQRQVDGNNVILPVWHDVTADEIKRHSPSLANIIAARSDDGLADVLGKIISIVGSDENDTIQTQALVADATHDESNALPPRQAIVTKFFDFDDVCLEFERLIESNESLALQEVLRENPQLLCFLLHFPVPSVIQTRPVMPAPCTFDAFALHVPQWTERTFFKFGAVNSPPFQPNGGWSDELVDAVGMIAGWIHKGDQEAFSAIAEDVARSCKSVWPSYSGYNSFDRLLSAARFANKTTFVLLFGRHQMIDENSRRLFHGWGLGRDVIQLRSYDTILRALYFLCPSITLPEPVVVGKLRVHRGDKGSITVSDEILDDINSDLRACLGKSASEIDSIRIVKLTLGVQGNLDDIPARHDSEGPEYSCTPNIDHLAMGIGDDNPDDLWHTDVWHHPTYYNSDVTPSTLRKGLTVRYDAPHIETDINIEVVVSKVIYRQRGAKLEGDYIFV